MKRVFLLFCFLGLLGRPPVAQPAATPVVHQADVIVYGGTSAAVIAAVQVARLGKTVLLVSPDTHLGGLSSGGLGFTDTGDKSVIGGLARSFYHRLYLHYQQDSAWRWQARSEYGNKGQSTVALDSNFKTMWIFEPHVAEQIFEQLVAEHRITVHRNTWLDRSATGVQRRQNKLQAFRATNGALYRGRMFIDATYEGDLMAAAGVQYHVGREANSTYGEQWNGVQTRVFQHDHYFKYKIDPYKQPGNPASGLLPEISAEPPGAYGSADKRLQAYCFRVCMSSHPDNRLPFPKPANYDSNRYELLLRLFAAGYRDVFSKFDPIPNRKTDTNNHGPFSFDFIGGNYAYPEASYEERQKIIAAHTTYQLGLLYFLQNDERVPADIRQRMQQYGLPKDEFKDNGGWPHQLYIREARRMVGQFVMKEADALGTTRIERPIGMGSYTLDSHNTQRYVESDGTVQNEGDIGVKPLRPYSIDYGAILPKEEQCANLLVPVCVSSSHIAYGSIRMEPVFMILGQSAATAAVLALEKRTSPQRLPYPVLAAALLKDGQILQQ